MSEPRVGLCLGAGGLTGLAFHAGVLAALQLDLGWDARESSVMVGTSAGAVSGAMLRLGTSPFELASWVLGKTWEPDQPLLDGIAAVRDDLPPLTLGTFTRGWRLPAVGTWAPVGRWPWSVRPLAVLSSMLPTDRTAMTELFARHMNGQVTMEWPRDLWICAVRRRDGRRVVFGRDPDESALLADAVAASASIPGYFAPVTIDGQEFLDGGIHSPTNADLLVQGDLDLDLAVIISPMSGGVGTGDRLLRQVARRRLRREVVSLRREGIEVIVFDPGQACTRAMGLNPMATDGIDRVLQAAFFEAGALIARPDVRRLLSPDGMFR